MFVRPEVEVIKFEAIDVIATSTGNDNGVGTVENTLVLPTPPEE